MKKDIINTIQQVFKNESFFTSLGFSELEAKMLHLLFNGHTIATTAEQMNIPYRVVSRMKAQCLHLIPIYLKRKLAVVNNLEFQLINSQLADLNNNINSYLEQLENNQVYDIMELNLSKRITNCLIASNIKNTRDLLELDRRDLLRIKNLGETAVGEIEVALKVLRLRSE